MCNPQFALELQLYGVICVGLLSREMNEPQSQYLLPTVQWISAAVESTLNGAQKPTCVEPSGP